MNPDSDIPVHSRAREIFLEALDQPDDSSRDRFVADACAGDDRLQREVKRLLADHIEADPFMAAPASGELPSLLLAEGPGTLIGRYKLLERIGEGGMGVVFMAEQREPVARRVALKVIRPGLDTRGVIARFEAERQALALMDHPNIAKVLDAGATDQGRPYFVMELVEGVPITEFCTRNKLSVTERLRLFLPVCHAVQHAHQKGVIHRDLKPSNILVTQSHGAPHPLVIDFGVAKATRQRLTEKTLFTNFGSLIGTPAYMSPEQAEPDREDVDTRSDLYSLGVLLYELLTGTTPFPEKRLRSAGLGEMLRILREEEPERPSTRLTRLNARRAAATSAAGAARSFLLDADLDWIVMKCLEKDRRRRYETVNGLAADLQRHLASEPVTARPPSMTYRLQKAVHRHRFAFAAGAAVAVALLLGLALATWQAVRATRAERAFREEAETATSVKAFLVEQVLGGADMWKRKRYDPSDRILIDRVAREVEGRFTNQPIVEAEVRDALADGFSGLDNLRGGLQQAERALALRKAHLGATHADTLASASRVGSSLYAVGRHREGDRMLDDTIAAARAASQMLTPGAAEALHARGWKLTFDGHPEVGLPHVKEALEIFRKTLGEDHTRTGAGRFMLAVVTQDLGQTNEAEALFREGIQQYSRSLGTNDPMVGVFLKGYGLLLRRMGRTNEAVANLEAAVANLRQALGQDNQYTLEAESHLSDTLAMRGNTNEATARSADLHRRWAQYLPYDIARRKIRDIAELFVRHHRYDEALAAFADVKEALAEVPPERPDEFEMLLRATAALEGWPAAAELCRTHFNQFSDSLSAWLTKAWVFHHVGDEKNYRDVVGHVLALRPAQVSTNEAHVLLEIAGLGNVDLSMAERGGLQARSARLEATLPGRAREFQQRGYRAIAQFQLRMGQSVAGLENLEKSAAVQSAPDAHTLFLKAVCLNRLGRREEALAALAAGDALMAAQAITPESERFLALSDLPRLALQREVRAELGRR